ncbi:MAG: alanine racemase, partial [Acidobacteriota bacterium]|nr:alanine racemase [Acidobacteriota bacterium]
EALPRLGALDGLRIDGLMAIPPRETETADARRWFTRLAELRDQVGRSGVLSDFRGELSMGMSGDFELAIEEGATHVRVGTAVFGARSG